MTDRKLLALTAQIVARYVETHQTPPQDLPSLIGLVRDSLGRQGRLDPVRVEIDRPSAAEIRRSVRRDSLVSFLNGDFDGLTFPKPLPPAAINIAFEELRKKVIAELKSAFPAEGQAKNSNTYSKGLSNMCKTPGPRGPFSPSFPNLGAQVYDAPPVPISSVAEGQIPPP